MSKITFAFYTDTGGGWLKVPITTLARVGVVDKITTDSYMDKNYAYLDEKEDKTTFLTAFGKLYGKEAYSVEHYLHTEGWSSIRSKQTYSVDEVSRKTQYVLGADKYSTPLQHNEKICYEVYYMRDGEVIDQTQIDELDEGLIHQLAQDFGIKGKYDVEVEERPDTD
jgi:hypothetical protein